MKLSKHDQMVVDIAHRLEIIWWHGGLLDKPGYAIRCVNSCASMLVGCPPKVWKTASGAYRAACKMRPDLLDTFGGILEFEE